MKNVVLVSAGLVLLTILVYGQTTAHEFINLDDAHYVSTNYYVKQGITLDGIYWAFTTNRSANWHPLTWLSLMLDANLYGLNAAGYHWTNLLLHAANAVLLFLVFHQMTGVIGPSAFVAAVFAVHPAHTESVAWVAERKDVLSTFFGFLTIWAYVRHARAPSAARYWLILLFFILSLASKQMLVTMPFLLLLLDYWPLGRVAGSGVESAHPTPFQNMGVADLIWEKVPIFAQSAVFCAVTVLAQRTGGAVTPTTLYSVPVRIANALVSYAQYLGMTFWPFGLGVYYPHPGDDVSFALAAGAAGLLLAITVAAFVWRRARPELIVGWLWYLGTLVPVIGLVQVGMQAMADRYTYIPMIGITIAVAWGLPALLPKEMPAAAKSALCRVAGALAVGFLAVVCFWQVGYWKDSGTLFEHTLEVAGPSPIGHSSLGQYYFTHQRLDDAIDEFKKAIALNSMVVLPRMNLGLALSLKGEHDAALEQVEEAARLAEKDPEVHHSLGVVLAQQGKYDEAIEAHTKATELAPEYSAAHNDLGILLSEKGDYEKAVQHLTAAMKFDPQSAYVRANLAELLLKQERYHEAAQVAKSAISLRKDFPEAYIAMAGALTGLRQFEIAATCLQQASNLSGTDPRLRSLIVRKASHLTSTLAELNTQAGKLDDAVANYRDALVNDPANPKLHNSMGTILAMQGKLDEAIKAFQEAARLDEKFAEPRRNLGQAYLSQGKVDAAVAEFRAAIALQPDWPGPKNDLAWLLATHPDDSVRNAVEAVQLAEEACQQTQNNSPDCLDTLAAAYAEAGEFPKAISQVERAAELALAAGRSSQAEELLKRRDQYREGRPFHEQPAPPTPPAATAGNPAPANTEDAPAAKDAANPTPPAADESVLPIVPTEPSATDPTARPAPAAPNEPAAPSAPAPPVEKSQPPP